MAEALVKRKITYFTGDISFVVLHIINIKAFHGHLIDYRKSKT
jgi:hypothetical protein